LKKAIKIVAIVLGIVILGVVALAIALPFVIDPNDYKDEIIQAVKENTGRELKVEGDIDLSIFPWLGVEMDRVELANASGFGKQPFAQIASAGVKVKVLPLLSRELVVDTIHMDGLRLNLVRNRTGKTNWDDLMASDTSASQAESSGAGIAALTVGGINIRDGEISWRDDKEGSRYALHKLTLKSGKIVPGKPVDLRGSFDLETGEPPKQIPIELNMRASLDLESQALDIPKLALSVDTMELTGQITGSQIIDAPVLKGSLDIGSFDARPLMKKLAIEIAPGSEDLLADVALKTDFGADLGRQTLELGGLSLKAGALAMTGDIKVAQLDKSPQVSGHVKIPPLDPRALMKSFDVTYETADKSVLGKLELSSEFSASANHLGLKKLDAKLDESTLQGSLAIRNFSKPSYTFDLTIDQIDLDRYLAPAEDATGEQDTVAALPLDTLRGLNLQGQLRVNKLKAFGLRSSNASMKLSAKTGVVTVGPSQAKLYGGSYSGQTKVDARQKTPKFTINEKLTGIDLAPLLKDAQIYEDLSGTGDLSMNFTARGANTDAVIKTLTGTGAIAARDGKIKGVNLQQSINDAKAKYDKLKGKSVDVTPKATDESVFSSLTATFNITNGVARNDDLRLQGANIRATGKGSVNLTNEKLDYRLFVTLAEEASREGSTVPVDIGGTLTQPQYKVAWSEALKDQATKKLATEKAKAKEEAEAKLEAKKQEQKDDLKEKLRKKLGLE
jgi:AsmA protein